MEHHRKIINGLDDQIMDLLVQRLVIVKDIGKYKKENNLPILDQKREKKIFDKIDEKYSNVENNQFLKKIYSNLMSETKEIQKEIFIKNHKNFDNKPILNL